MNPLRNEKTWSAPYTIPSEVHFENELNFTWKCPMPRFVVKPIPNYSKSTIDYRTEKDHPLVVDYKWYLKDRTEKMDRPP
ncbi:hypothetical protein TNCV_2827921 [Trichonephila clavipes]|nr:hypothetical protein TNCV_2827921 [Trichonephila clavipes]